MMHSANNIDASATETVNCPICEISDSSPFTHSNGYQVVKCQQCGMLYVNPRIDRSKLSNYFEEDYIKDHARAEVDFTTIREESLKREAEIVKKLLPHGGRLLDVGCASGAFLGYFAGDPDWNVQGVEPSRFAAEFAEKKYCVKVHSGFLCGGGYPAGDFDIVVSLDTFYYHPDPNKDASEIARILKPGGYFAVEIPGLRFRLLKNTGLVCRLMYGEPARLNAGEHIYFYSKNTMTALLKKHGFSPVESYPEQSPLTGGAASKILNKFYFNVTGSLYKMTGGRSSFVPKEFLIFKKD